MRKEGWVASGPRNGNLVRDTGAKTITKREAFAAAYDPRLVSSGDVGDEYLIPDHQSYAVPLKF
jgi:hypothetical protein